MDGYGQLRALVQYRGSPRGTETLVIWFGKIRLFEKAGFSRTSFQMWGI